MPTNGQDKLEDNKITVTITYDPSTQQIQLLAPMENRMLVYGMLGMARDIVHSQAQKVKASPIVLPRLH
jgi:hypothetical protein